MNLLNLITTLHVRGAARGHKSSDTEVTVVRGEGHEAITDIVFCHDCQEFHILTERK